MRVAILGMGAIGNVVKRALDGRAELLEVDRTKSPLRDGERPVDVALVTTKTFGTAWAAEQAAKLLGPAGVALTIQNGLGNHEVLAERLGAERVQVGVIYVGAALRQDGSLFATGPGRVELGADPRLDALARALADGGMTVTRVDDPWRSVWRKLVVNAALNPTSAVLSCTNGELLAHPAGAPLADGLAREVARVATAAGVPLTEEEAVAAWRSAVASVSNNRSSMLQDVEAGRRTEIEAINGAIASAGARLRVATPLSRAFTVLVSALTPAP